ncbi:hypothetical protein LUZ60_007293 [Juncus effusus]|nr:hypothetical protein LUZ60_007293 [Juncus effusus]
MSNSLRFIARRSKPVLVAPSQLTPHEFKPLSDIDDQEALRFYRSVILFYPDGPSKAGLDPARVLKEALAKVLVYYYPLAGRLREFVNRKLVVECTGEGVVFVEADADVSLRDFEGKLTPPIPCAEELLCLPESSSAVVTNRPLFYFQVTRLLCGGFTFGMQICHSMGDAPGLMQFLMALGEMVQGAEAPTVRPVWDRHLLDARDPPQVMYNHPEFEPITNQNKDKVAANDKSNIHHAFFFSFKDIESLRRMAPPNLQSRCTRFDLLASFVWRTRTISLRYDPNDEVRFLFVVNARGFKRKPPLPEGYYGNALIYGVATSSVEKLCNNGLGYALKLVMKAKERIMTDDYVQSVADYLVLKSRPRFTTDFTYMVTDQTKAKLNTVDLGWGRPVYGAPATVTLATFHMPMKNDRGEQGITVPMCLPSYAMDTFTREMEKLYSADQFSVTNAKL